MSLTNKVAQFDADSDLVNAWVHGPASGIGSTVTTDSGTVRTPAKLIADKEIEINAATTAAINLAIAGNIDDVQTVSINMSDVTAVVNNLANIKAAPANADIASTAVSFLTTYIDRVVMNVTFPLDLGLIIDPVGPVNTFDLGAI